MSVITDVENPRILAKKRLPRMFHEDADSRSWCGSTCSGHSRHPLPVTVTEDAGIDTP